MLRCNSKSLTVYRITTTTTTTTTTQHEGNYYYYTTVTTLHPFNGPLSGTTQVSRYQKGKTNLDFTAARDGE